MTVHALFENNSLIIELTVKDSQDNSPVNDAIAEVTILDKNHKAIAEHPAPKVMDYILQSDGLYRAIYINSPSIKRERTFYVKVKIQTVDGLISTFETEAVGKVKDF